MGWICTITKPSNNSFCYDYISPIETFLDVCAESRVQRNVEKDRELCESV